MFAATWPEAAAGPPHSTHASGEPHPTRVDLKTASLFVLSNKLELTTSHSVSGICLENSLIPEGSVAEHSVTVPSEAAAVTPGTSMHVLWRPSPVETVLSAAAYCDVAHACVQQSSMPAAAVDGAAELTSPMHLGTQAPCSHGGCAAAVALVATEHASNASLVFWCVATGGVCSGAAGDGPGSSAFDAAASMHAMHASTDEDRQRDVLGCGVGVPRCGTADVWRGGVDGADAGGQVWFHCHCRCCYTLSYLCLQPNGATEKSHMDASRQYCRHVSRCLY